MIKKIVYNNEIEFRKHSNPNIKINLKYFFLLYPYILTILLCAVILTFVSITSNLVIMKYVTISINKELSTFNNKKTVELFGGEPLLRKDITDVLDFLIDKGFNIKIATNGTHSKIQSSNMYKYVNNKNVHFRISLDGHTKDIHEKYRTKNSFEKIVDNVKYLTSNNGNISLKSIITDLNFNYLEDILYYFKTELKVNIWNYNALYNLDYT